jgi:FtsZ-binding cell division protein ZapB
VLEHKIKQLRQTIVVLQGMLKEFKDGEQSE